MRSKILKFIAATAALAAINSPYAEALVSETARECASVALQAQDKVNAKTETISAKVGEPVVFEGFKIIVRHCLKAGIAEPADTAIFLDVYKSGDDGKDLSLFKGWMFASSPSLSTLDHPTFGIWVKRDQEHDKDQEEAEITNTSHKATETPSE